MVVIPEGDRCGVPADYEVSLGTPRLPVGDRPGNTGKPHAVVPEVITFLADMGSNLMSLSNNHAWALGGCGVEATHAAAEANGVSYAGTGPDISKASAPGYLTVGDFTIALVAATTSNDERSAIGCNVNGVWTGRKEDWDRNLATVRDAAAKADFVLYYHHFQLDLDKFSEVSPGDTTSDGHMWVDDLDEGETYRSDFDDPELLSRRGLAQLTYICCCTELHFTIFRFLSLQ
jgi:hypothetical protein